LRWERIVEGGVADQTRRGKKALGIKASFRERRLRDFGEKEREQGGKTRLPITGKGGASLERNPDLVVRRRRGDEVNY